MGLKRIDMMFESLLPAMIINSIQQRPGNDPSPDLLRVQTMDDEAINDCFMEFLNSFSVRCSCNCRSCCGFETAACC